MIRLCGTNKRNIGIFVCVVFEEVPDRIGGTVTVIDSIHLRRKSAEKRVNESPDTRRLNIKYLHIWKLFCIFVVK